VTDQNRTAERDRSDVSDYRLTNLAAFLEEESQRKDYTYGRRQVRREWLEALRELMAKRGDVA
jgi:hypothetical protein